MDRFLRLPRPAPLLALALLSAATPDALRAQRDTIFIPANPVSRPPVVAPSQVRDSTPTQAPTPTQDQGQNQNVAIVPNLTGMTVEDAREILARQKLTLGALEELVTPGVPGTVARQRPPPGTRVAPGSAIPVWLVAARVAVMPAIMGLPRERAERMVRQAGLRVGVVSGTEGGPRIRVISHTFHAGERVPAGATVNLSLGIPPAQPGQVAQRDTPRAPAPGRTPPDQPGLVAQRDTPRTQQPQAERVDSAAVPEVRAMELAAARRALASAGLAAGIDPAFADSAGWTVAEQTPGPGSLIPLGTPVQLALAPPVAIAAGPGPAPSTGVRRPPPAPVQPPPDGRRRTVLLAIAALLLLLIAVAAAMRMRGGKAPPPALVRARLRTEVEPRTTVSGAPFADARLRLRVRSGAPVARVAALGPLFAQKEVAGD